MAESDAKKAKGSSGSLLKALSVFPTTNVDGSLAFRPISAYINPMLTDLYQVSMAYAYWKSGKHNDHAVFDLFFRKNPFGGEFTVFAGLEDCLRYLSAFKFSDSDMDYLRTQLPPSTEPEFFTYLKSLTTQEIELYALEEGSIAFPRVPLIRVEGPLALVQLFETTFLTLVNYASLVTTNAARYRIAAGEDKTMLEFGLRRAQGPDGGMTASKYTYIGGCDGTSNVLAGKLYGIPIYGTHAHAFVSSFSGDYGEIKGHTLAYKDQPKVCANFPALVESYASRLSAFLQREMASIKSELVAFTAFAIAFPENFLALIDTYDVLKSGAPNFCAVALALGELGYTAKGIRLDSGDLAYQSKVCRKMFQRVAEEFKQPAIAKSTIVASNDINEVTLNSLNSQGHCIDAFGIGTHLVTCQSQPALGAVYKLVEVNGEPRIKISADMQKVTIPCRKNAFRLFGQDGRPICDIMQMKDEDPPKPGEKVLCRHPFEESKRANVCPKKVEPLYRLFYKDNKVQVVLPTLIELHERVKTHVANLRPDHVRQLNPTPYKVSVTSNLYTFMHQLWLSHAPVGELS